MSNEEKVLAFLDEELKKEGVEEELTLDDVAEELADFQSEENGEPAAV
jgi:hypothetical protein